MARNEECRCSFCGKPESKVRKLLAGPAGVCICDECLDVCNDIMEEELEYDSDGSSEFDMIYINQKKLKNFLMNML